MSGNSWIVAATAFAVTVIGVPIVRQLCFRFGLHDRPGPLKIHTQPTSRLGGAAIALSLIAGMCLVTDFHIDLNFVAALGLIWTAGFFDDVRGLSLGYRLAAQFAGAILLWLEGWRLPYLGSGPMGFLGICIYIAATANAFNFLDGADGIAAGVAACIAAGYVALPGIGLSPFGSLVASSLLGACAGFLIFNFPPAKIFMGDSGSTTLGFGIAFLGLDFYRGHSAPNQQLLFPILIAALPLLDTVLAVLRRILSRVSPFEGDRRHAYDLLLARGWSPRRVAFTCYANAIAMGMAGWLAMRSDLEHAAWIAVLSVGALLFVALRLGALRTDRRHPSVVHAKI